MPHTNIDYNKTIIYKLVCNDVNIPDCYVGHTTDFTRRKLKHKTCCNNINGKKYNLNVYSFIRDNDNWSMVVIEQYKCNNSIEAKQKERYYIELLKASLNSNIPTRTPQEYYIDNKETITEQQKQYYDNNKDKLIEYQKQYNNNNKDKLIEYQKQYIKKKIN